MTEEVAQLDPITFDIGDVLAGRKYPTKEVTVYLDEELALELADVEDELATIAVISDIEKTEALEAERDRIVEELSKSKLVFRLEGTPRKVRKDIGRKTFDKFPEETTPLGLPVPNIDRDNFYWGLMWEAHIREVVAPNGAVGRPTPEELEKFRDEAPDYASTQVQAGIDSLLDNTTKGFEAAAQRVDFLSRTSPKE